VRTITLNRPAAYNSLTTELKERLLATLRDAEADDAVRAVVLTGAGKAFCAGQDLKEHAVKLREGDPAPLRTVVDHYNPITRTIIAMPKPTIAAVNGSAAGAGAAFSYACDLRIAARSASFVMAFATAGLGPDSGASWTLQRLIGLGRATELMLLARPVGAEEAHRIGLVTQVVDDDELAAAAQQVAARLASGPTATYAEIKHALSAAATSSFEDALALEDQVQTRLGSTADHREAVDAFVSKRRPTFTGR
jgi:2-(1,2-epoxy-1,2-dihydrophenyl)acetyl-CoA isomerase